MLYLNLIMAAAKSAGVSGSLLLALCTHESGLKNTLVPHDGGSPTYGICQIKAGAAQMVGFKGDENWLMDPATNAKYAALYLKYQIDRYHGSHCMAVAAYNMGSYVPSKSRPGQPINMGYVTGIQNKDSSLASLLSCPITKIAGNLK